jgi:hypothetical protein
MERSEALAVVMDTAAHMLGVAVVGENPESVRHGAVSRARTLLSARTPEGAQFILDHGAHLLAYWEAGTDEDLRLRAAFESLAPARYEYGMDSIYTPDTILAVRRDTEAEILAYVAHWPGRKAYKRVKGTDEWKELT